MGSFLKNRHRFFERHVHFKRMLDRAARLFFKRGGAPIPEEALAPREVPKRRRVAFERDTGHALAARGAIGKALRRIVAGDARLGAVAGQPRVGEQRGAKRDLLRRGGIVRRKRHRRGPRKIAERHALLGDGLRPGRSADDCDRTSHHDRAGAKLQQSLAHFHRVSTAPVPADKTKSARILLPLRPVMARPKCATSTRAGSDADLDTQRPARLPAPAVQYWRYSGRQTAIF